MTTLCDRKLTMDELVAQDKMRVACLTWIECPPERRPTAEALGRRIAELAGPLQLANNVNPNSFCLTCHSQPSLCFCLKGNSFEEKVRRERETWPSDPFINDYD